MKQNQYQEIVFKALAYIKENGHRQFSIPELAEHLGFTERHVLKAFRKILNQSVVEAIRTEKINRAKALLQKTQLGITSVAFESGFGDYGHFAKTFRRKVGIAPQEFRKKVLLLQETPMPDFEPVEQERREEWFRDSFHGAAPGAHWKPVEGTWRCRDDQLEGLGASVSINFLRPIPENCRVSFQVIADPMPGLDIPDVALSLYDDSFNASYCQFSLALGNTAKSESRHSRNGHRWNQAARIVEHQWNEIALEINDDRVSLSLNGVSAFSFRDAFPAPYFGRCHLSFSAWHCNIRLRKLVIHNLGFMPVLRPIRQGDALYNSGLIERAMQFYLRYLQAGSATDEETMELRHKIGMCCLRLGSFSQARSWMDKVVNLQENRFWAEQTRLALLELHWRAADVEMLLDNMRHSFADPAIRDQARVIILFAITDYVLKGFYPEAHQLLLAWSSMELPDSYAQQRAHRDLADHLQRMRRFDEAEAVLLELLRTSTIAEIINYSQINLMQVYHEWGKIFESERLRKEIESRTQDPYMHVRCTIQEALNLRAQGQLEESLKILKDIPVRYVAIEKNFYSHAQIHCAFILCGLGRVDEGRLALEEARKIDPGIRFDSRHYLPFHLAERNHLAAAETVLTDYQNAKDLVSSSAELGVKAGILHELAGLTNGAKAILKEVSLRFPNEQVRFFGLLADQLMGEKVPLTLSSSKCERTSASSFDKTCPESTERVRMSDEETGKLHFITQMPYEHYRRSEMFYLLGLLKEERGDKAAARRLFEQCVKEDPALRWPAFFAKTKLCGN